MIKKCTKCESEWPADLDHYYKDQSKKDNLSSSCKRCQQEHHKNLPVSDAKRESKRRYKQTVKGKFAYWKHHIKAAYGMTPEDYYAMFDKQKGSCGICKKEVNGKRMCIDHDHVTGKIRELICDRCNKAIGLCEDNRELLRRMISYIGRHE